MKTLVKSIEREFETVGNTQLIEDIVQMVLHGLFADEHLFSHLFVLISLGDKLDYLSLTLAQWGSLACFAGTGTPTLARHRELSHHSGRSVRVQPDFPTMNLPNALDDQFGSGLLEYNARAPQLHGL